MPIDILDRGGIGSRYPEHAKLASGAPMEAIMSSPMFATDLIRDGDDLRIHDSYASWNHVIPLPPHSLLWSVGGASLELFMVLSDAWGQVMASHLRPRATVLDIGCGCGRAARSLVPNPIVARYIGFDVIEKNIAWCNKFIKGLYPLKSEFIHLDVFSAEYNRDGVLRGVNVEFPAPDGSVDLCVASSLFTHLLEDDCRHYLDETRRVMSRDGCALFSIHTQVHSGLSFVGCESRIDIEPAYWEKMVSEADLIVEGVSFELGGQQLYVLRRPQQ